jgi:probable HAF family extracellular repeat protein
MSTAAHSRTRWPGGICCRAKARPQRFYTLLHDAYTSPTAGNVIGGQGGSRSFLLSRGEGITIRVIGDRAVFPEAINNRRQVVGWAHDEQGQRHGFMINDRRQLVAFGPDSRVADGEFRFYLLTPVQ